MGEWRYALINESLQPDMWNMKCRDALNTDTKKKVNNMQNFEATSVYPKVPGLAAWS
jgi:hypothetical protein